MTNRYKGVEGSQTAHCCFEFTVVDTRKPKQYNEDFEEVCETFERDDADLIASALNAQHDL